MLAPCVLPVRILLWMVKSLATAVVGSTPFSSSALFQAVDTLERIPQACTEHMRARVQPLPHHTTPPCCAAR